MQYSSTEHYSTSTRDSPSSWHNKGKGKEDKGYVYKKSSYQYAGNNNNSASYQSKTAEQNIDQLDALLEDLKNERQVTTREREHLPVTNFRAIDAVEPLSYSIDGSSGSGVGSAVTKTTRIVKTTKHGSSQPITDEIETFSSTDYNGLKSTNYASFQDSLKRDELQHKDKLYGPGATHYESKSKIYESNRLLNSTELIPAANSTSIQTTSTTNIEKELQDIALDDNILPVPGTKVTTTVRTYTYEIPPGGSSTTTTTNTINRNQRLQQQHHNYLYNETHATPPTHVNVPQTVVYNTENYSTLNRNTERPIVTNQSYEVHDHKEVTNTFNNAAPIGTTLPAISRYPVGGPHNPTSLPPSGGTTNRYFYKETSNVVNTLHGPPPASGPQGPAPLNAYPTTRPQGIDYSPPANNSYSSYKYTSSTVNNRHGPEYGAPSPFPIDGVEYPIDNRNPPQRVDELMQSFSNTDAVDRVDVESPSRKREIETAVATPNQQHVPSVNKAGKEVYYPPGHDMMITKREEMTAGSAAGGRWAKGSGMYEYESGYKSKTKTKSGGAMVPVCLPLCCAMPCTIM